MKDKIRFDYAECQVEITCSVCSTTFPHFPDSDEPLFSCPKCDRHYRFVFDIEPMNSQEVLKKKLKDNLLEPVDK